MDFNREDVQELHAEGRLAVEPHAPVALAGGGGVRRLELAEKRDGLVYVPAGASARATGLVLLLHGSGADGQQMIDLFGRDADRLGLILLAPDSRGRSWDIVGGGGFGPDVEFLDRALDRVFDRYRIDPARIAIGGFSDGASYALSLGIGNGRLFHAILAFSPGFSAPGAVAGKPLVFVAHGAGDKLLPVDRCSRRIVARLEATGYDVTYVEVGGGHAVPDEIRTAAFAWLEPDPPALRARRTRPRA